MPRLKESDLRDSDAKSHTHFEYKQAVIDDLIKYKKQTKKFIKSLSEVVAELTPTETRKDPSTLSLKEIWKWLQNLLKEYMKLKKDKDRSANNSKKSTPHSKIQEKSKEEEEDNIDVQEKEESQILILESMKILQIKDKADYLPALAEFLIYNNKMSLLLSKVQEWLDDDQIGELQSFER